MDVRQKLAIFVSEELLQNGEPVDFDDNLLADGMVDSLGMLRLVGYIGDTYGFNVPPQDFIIENFRTLNVLNRYLALKLDELPERPHES